MGTQVNFYMTEDDESAFLAFAARDADLAILPYALPEGQPTGLEMLPRLGTPFSFSLWLWNRAISPKPRLSFIEAQNYYTVDSMASEVVSLSRCHRVDDRIIRGRIWAEMNGRIQGVPGSNFAKGEAFQKWYLRLAGWIKRNGECNTQGDYIMPRAADAVRQGARLTQVYFSADVKRFEG